VDEFRAADRPHLQRLIGAWGVVADFCFGDLLLFVPEGPRGPNGVPSAFTVIGQVRPTTSQTLYLDDLVGRIVPVGDRPLLADCFVTGEIRHGQNFTLAGSGDGSAPGARVEYIPVRRRRSNGELRTIGVLTRELAIDAARRPGRLERVYLEVFDRIAEMVAAGLFPFDVTDEETPTDPPRVGDGVIAIDATRVVTYASPNAMSALHRLGLSVNAEGRSLGSLGVGLAVAEACFTSRTSVTSEIERVAVSGDGRVIVALAAMPLLRPSSARPGASSGGGAGISGAPGVPGVPGVPASPEVTGAVVLLRDVSDLRRRDRLLVTKDATIREVHHRVKNNLQTISALLRLQGRRTSSDEARTAIEESARRIRVIALVHETLSRDVRDAVPFDDIVRPLVRMVEDSLVSPERPVRIRVEGSIGDLAPETATPLAVVLTELVQNAVEHGYPAGDGPDAGNVGNVVVHLARTDTELVVEVSDDGVGLPDGFVLASSKSLGLSIVRTLITTELGGAIAFRTESGTVAELRVPLLADPRVRR
jgi:two-component sensor histidine kinase